MVTTVLFVHGTGVREADYHKTLVRVKKCVARALPKAKVEPCLWGDSHGATLAKKGISIPDFSGEPSPRDESGEKALWQLLSADPTFELREMIGLPRAPGLRQAAALDALPGKVRALGDSAAALARLPETGDTKERASRWSKACAAIAGAEALTDVLKASQVLDGRLRTAVARACVARWQWQSAFMEGGTMSADNRDGLVQLLNNELGGVEKGLMPEWVKARFKGMLLRWATDKAHRERDVLFNAAYPAAGDILLYQSDGQAIRDFIAGRIDACKGDVVVMAHSLGGIACVELLVQQHKPSVKALVTFGSQAPLLYELGALGTLKPPHKLPKTFPRRWINVYDRDDLLSYVAAPIFKPVAKDLQARSGQPFPDAHSAYWDQDDVWERLSEELA